MLAVLIALALTTPEVSNLDRWELKERAGEYYIETYQPEREAVAEKNDSVTVEATNNGIKVEAKW